MQIQPYLFLEGRAEEAIDFYKKALRAEVKSIMRFKESPEPAPPGMHPPGSENKIMHSAVQIGDSTIFISDGRASGEPKFQGFSLSVSAKDGAEAERIFNALSAGGKVTMPLGKTFFTSHFGMLADRFGVHWMVIVM
jgi:PhnB protein